jgi:hypothetical protein
MNIHYIYKLVLKWKQEKKDKKNENVKMWVFLIGSSTPLLKVVVSK